MTNQLISIIIPVYNTAPFLETCLSSLREQTYTHFEAILIDDGSTDESNQICHAFVQKDSRFRLYTQSNAGRSAARNKGLDMAQGELICFVDSDDWIDKDMLETLYKAYTQHEASIVQCSYYYHKEKEVTDMSHSALEGVRTSRQGLELLFRDKQVKNFLWNNLFERSLFTHIRFPESKDFEDVAVMYQLFAKSRYILFLKTAKYHYRVSHSSISHATFSLKSKLDYLDALNAQYHFAQSAGLWKKSAVVLSKKYLGILNEFLRNRVDESQTDLLKHYLKDHINGWRLLCYSPYRAFRRLICLYCYPLYTLSVKKK